ncbi:MAG: hypothetical protein ACAH83_00190 [Alphaproteobacteria bacterium]
MMYTRISAAACAVCIVVSAFLLFARVALEVPGLGPLLFGTFPLVSIFLLACAGAFAYGRVLAVAQKFLAGLIESSGAALQSWGKGLPARGVYPAIIVLSATTLFLELVLIRWQGSLFPIFALYKNFTLLACFCGLGIGYALTQKKPLLLPAALPLLALTTLLLTTVRYTCAGDLLFYVPIQEETSVFAKQLHASSGLLWAILQVPAYLLLIVTFVLNVLIMMPVAQFCGHVMSRVDALPGYGCNLAGSIAGVALLFLLSWLWTGPVIWLALGAAPVLWYQLSIDGARRAGIGALIATVIICAFPAEPTVHNIYSPYQFIQKSSKPDGYMEILSGGTYFQKVYNLSLQNKNREAGELKKIVGYYELPFRTAPSLGRVAIVGAGSGNDVAAALRIGAKAVDAVEIDPAILALGLANHPEHPYDDRRVNIINNDARTFFRNTRTDYDTIVYGVLDSHILLSHGSNVRLDSFVYTQEGLREAYAHLKQGGLMSVSFALPNLRMGFKVYSMVKELPGAGRPVVVLTGYDTPNTCTFMIRKGGEVTLPAGFLPGHDLADTTKNFSKAWDGALDLPTDDWPFFYMDAKMYPSSYVVSLLLILALAFVCVRVFLPGQKWDRSMLPFFFLGAGFMLVETKAITELGLIFGNTWQVIGITIIGVLVMAFLANLLVSRHALSRTFAPYVLLLAVILLGYVVAIHGGLPQAGIFMKLGMVVLLTSPLLFSGIVFSTLLKEADDLPSALAYNLMGAMLGGLLEYNSMQFGFAFLYLIALGLYALAWLTSGRNTLVRLRP